MCGSRLSDTLVALSSGLGLTSLAVLTSSHFSSLLLRSFRLIHCENGAIESESRACPNLCKQLWGIFLDDCFLNRYHQDIQWVWGTTETLLKCVNCFYLLGLFGRVTTLSASISPYLYQYARAVWTPPPFFPRYLEYPQICPVLRASVRKGAASGRHGCIPLVGGIKDRTIRNSNSRYLKTRILWVLEISLLSM